MAAREFTEEICEQLYRARKYLASVIKWQRVEGRGVFTFEATVLTEDGEGLDLFGYINKNPKRYNRTVWGFSLKYAGYPVRTYDMGKKHKNPRDAGGGKVKGQHKHRFSSSKIDRYAYKPDPPISEENHNQALMDFLKESNIELETEYQDFIVF